MSNIDGIRAALDKQLNRARASRHRCLVVFSGDRKWALQTFKNWFQYQCFDVACLVGDSFVGDSLVGDSLDIGSHTSDINIRRLKNNQAKQLLGQDTDCIFYDAWSGFDPEALAISTGTLVGGGMLILSIPVIEKWFTYQDPDYRRLQVYPFKKEDIEGRFVHLVQRSLLAASDILIVEKTGGIRFLNESKFDDTDIIGTRTLIEKSSGVCVTDDQYEAVESIIKVANGRSRRPLVIDSDRGRGKTSALGIASAYLLQQKDVKIIITALHSSSIKAALERASEILATKVVDNKVMSGSGSLVYLPPDEILRSNYSADLLLVDEAAAIPVSMLTQLLKRYNRIVYSTTIHGYEGTGRGFEIRFKNVLSKFRPQWKNLQMKQPVRWAKNDPVEKWLFDALLLDARATESIVLQNLDRNQCRVELLDRDHLLDDKVLLQQVFGLLVLAHYRTSPGDLRNLLDGPNIDIWVTRYCGQVIGAAMVAKEGGLDTEMTDAIWSGKRRPIGHLLPQTLSFHSGFQQAPMLTYQRIIRIAVHPEGQRKGIGRDLVEAIKTYASKNKIDFIGASFAATADVVAFWRALQCSPVRLGYGMDARSGCHSAIVLRPLSIRGQDLFEEISGRFVQQFCNDLPLFFDLIDTDLITELLSSSSAGDLVSLGSQDSLDINAFTEGLRQFEQSRFVLSKLLIKSISQDGVFNSIDENDKVLLIRRILQNSTIAATSVELGYSGKKTQLIAMRRAIKQLNTAQTHDNGGFHAIVDSLATE